MKLNISHSLIIVASLFTYGITCAESKVPDNILFDRDMSSAYYLFSKLVNKKDANCNNFHKGFTAQTDLFNMKNPSKHEKLMILGEMNVKTYAVPDAKAGDLWIAAGTEVVTSKEMAEKINAVRFEARKQVAYFDSLTLNKELCLKYLEFQRLISE